MDNGCHWSGDLPQFKETSLCAGCQKQCSAGDVIRCRMRGGPEPATPPVVKPPKATKPVRPPQVYSGIGDRFKARMELMKIKQKSGCPCKDVQSDLNRSTPEQVKENLEMFVDKVFSNVKNVGGLMGVAAQVFSFISPESAKGRIREILLECLEDPAKMADASQTL